MYNNVQTGAKSQFGGLKLGLFKVRYQVLTELCVAKLDRKPTNKQILTEIKIVITVFFKAMILKVTKEFMNSQAIKIPLKLIFV